jgi:hypothetical protein
MTPRLEALLAKALEVDREGQPGPTDEEALGAGRELLRKLRALRAAGEDCEFVLMTAAEKDAFLERRGEIGKTPGRRLKRARAEQEDEEDGVGGWETAAKIVKPLADIINTIVDAVPERPRKARR